MLACSLRSKRIKTAKVKRKYKHKNKNKKATIVHFLKRRHDVAC
jgi:hypothetical protein